MKTEFPGVVVLLLGAAIATCLGLLFSSIYPDTTIDGKLALLFGLVGILIAILLYALALSFRGGRK